MSVSLPVARCGVDGCPQKVAWLRLRESGDPEPEVEEYKTPGWDDLDWELPRSRRERFRHIIPAMRMNDPEGVDRMKEYVSQGWLVGWCRKGGHGPRWVRVTELEDALDSGRTVVFAHSEPGFD